MPEHYDAMEKRLKGRVAELEAQLAAESKAREADQVLCADLVVQRAELRESLHTAHEQITLERAIASQQQQRAKAAESRLREVEADTIERCANVCEKVAERRFEEYGYTESDTGASYYHVKSTRDEYETRDEEDVDCAVAIRALAPSRQTEPQRQEFEAVTRPVIEWLNANCHPHVTVVIKPTCAELSEGTIVYSTEDYLRD